MNHILPVLPDTADYQIFCEYLDELQTISGLSLRTSAEKKYLYDEIREYEFSNWVDIYKDDDVIGFFIIGTGENCHPSADYYIQESYIKPEYRRQKYMTNAISDFVRKHEGIYCLFILNENKIAKTFWSGLFERLGYKPYYLRDVGAADEYCTQYGFAPKGMV